MSIQQVQTGYPATMAVRLLDGADAPVMGVAYTALTVRYQKQGGAWTVKVVQPAEWVEGPEGRYMLSFSASELDTVGRFVFRVEAAGATTVTGDIDVVTDWATVVEMLTALLNGLNTKVSRSDAATVKHQQDDAVGVLNGHVDSILNDVSRINSQLSVILYKMKSLP